MNNEKKVPNKYRMNSCQIHMEIPLEFNERLVEAAKRQRMTKASYMFSLLKRELEGDGTSSIHERFEEQDKRIEKIDNKLDTIINMISKL